MPGTKSIELSPPRILTTLLVWQIQLRLTTNKYRRIVLIFNSLLVDKHSFVELTAAGQVFPYPVLNVVQKRPEFAASPSLGDLPFHRNE
jgi:hypothetical protein